MCKVKARIRGREVVIQTIGYRGKKEAHDDYHDLKQARNFIVYKRDVRGLGLRVGSTVTVRIGSRRVKCKVKKWSRGSRLLVPLKDYPLKELPRKEFKEVHVD